MVAPINFNPITDLSPTKLFNPISNFSIPAPIPFGGNFDGLNNNYNNDIMSKNTDFSSYMQNYNSTPIPFSGTSAQPAPANAAATVSTQNTNQQTQSKNNDKPLGLIKYLTATGGILAPIITKAIHNGTFKNIFKNKELAVSCPVLGIIGLGLGYLIERCTKSRISKAQAQQEVLQD